MRGAATIAAALALAACGGREASPARAPDDRGKNAAPSAPTIADVKKAAQEAFQAADWPAYRARLAELVDRIGATSSLVGATARAEARLGHAELALAWLERYAAMGLAREGLDADPDFAHLHASPRWAPLLERLAENARPVQNATLALHLPDEELLAEDLAWDSRTKTFYVSAVRARTIVAVRAEGGAAHRFVAAGQDGLFSVLGLGVDERRGRLWASTAALPEGDAYRSDDAGRTAVHLYDLASGKLVRRTELPRTQSAPHALTDLAVLPSGDALVSDALGGRLYVARQDGALDPIDDGKTFGSPQTPAIDHDADTVFVPDYGRGIAVLALHTRAVRWLAHDDAVAVDGIDGLYLAGPRTLVAVQNGTAPERIVRLDLDEARTKIERLTVLEQGSPFLGDPTHGVVLTEGSEAVFYFIGQSGWEHMAPDGTVKVGESPRGSVVLRLAIR